MGIIKNIKNIYKNVDKNVFAGKLPGGYVVPKKTTTTSTTIKPNTTGISVRDYSDGSSDVTRTTTTPSGGTTTTVTRRSSGGGSSVISQTTSQPSSPFAQPIPEAIKPFIPKPKPKIPTSLQPYTLTTSATDIMKGKIFVDQPASGTLNKSELTPGQVWAIIKGGDVIDIIKNPTDYLTRNNYYGPTTPAYADPFTGQSIGGTEMSYGTKAPQIIPIKVKETKQPVAPPVYLGGQEILFRNRPVMDETIGGGTQDLIIQDITINKNVGFIRSIEEKIPGFGTTTSLNEEVYLPDKLSVDTYNSLINDPNAGSRLRKFLRGQQERRLREIGELNALGLIAQANIERQERQREIDLERFNTLNALIPTTGLTPAQQKEIESLLTTLNGKYSTTGLNTQQEIRQQQLLARVNQGSMGTGMDIVYKATEANGNYGTALRLGLKGGLAAYSIEKDVLGYQIGAGALGVGLGAMGSTGGTIAKVVSTVSKPLRYAVAPLGLTYGTLQGVKEYRSSGDMRDAFAVGLGSIGGYFGSVYSKEIVEGMGKIGNWIVSHTQSPRLPEYSGPKGTKGAKGSGSKQEMVKPKPKQKPKVKISKGEAIEYLKQIGTGDKEKLDALKKLRDLIGQNPEMLKSKKDMDMLGDAIKQAYGEDYYKVWKEMFVQTTYILGGESNVGPTGSGIQDVKVATPIGGSAQATIFGDPSVYTGTGVYERTGDLFQPFVDVGTKGKQSQDMFQGLVFGGMFDSSYDNSQESDKKYKYDNKPLVKSRTRQVMNQANGVFTITSPDTSQDSKNAQASLNATITTTITDQDTGQDTGQTSNTISSPRIGQPRPRPDPRGGEGIKPPTIPPITFGFWWPGEKEAYKKESQVGYHASVKEKNKWRQVTKKPHTRMGAMDMGARLVDNTTAATWRINPIKQTKTIRGKKVKQQKVFKGNELAKGDGYFKQTEDKYRNFSIYKGRQRPLGNTWIEKKNRRNDTPGEASGLVLSQAISRGVKRSRGLPVRRNKSNGRMPFRL